MWSACAQEERAMDLNKWPIFNALDKGMIETPTDIWGNLDLGRLNNLFPQVIYVIKAGQYRKFSIQFQILNYYLKHL